MQGKLTLNKDHFDAYFDQLENQLDEVARGVVIVFWNNVLVNTPQWTGAMAASWNFTLNAPDPVDRHDEVQSREEEPNQRGHPTGIGIANDASRAALNSFKLGDVAYLTNGVTDEHANYYAQGIEDGLQRLRAVNRPGNAVALSLGVIDAKYSRGIPMNTAKALRRLRI